MIDDFISPKNDTIFKLLFGDERSLEILTDFLKSVLRLPEDEYEDVTLIDPQLKREYDGDKLSVMDVRIRTKAQKTINIEIQLLSMPELRERIVYYLAKMVTGQVGAGESYQKIKRVISIIITDFIFIPGTDEYHNRFTLYDPGTRTEFTDVIEVNTLELVKLPESEDGTKLWAWMKFLSARNKEDLNMIAQSSPQVKQAVMRYMEMTEDEQIRMRMELQQKKEWDIRGQERRNAMLSVAKNLLDIDMPVDQIISATGLTRVDIENIRDNQ